MADQLKASVNALRLLQPPDDLADSYTEWIGLRADLLKSMRAVQEAGNNHDEAGVEEGLSDIRETQARADELAEELGLADCSPTGITLEHR